MKTFLKLAVVAATLSTAAITTAAPASAGVAVSFDVGHVAFAYRDGWWDRDHRWHGWRDRDEWREYRINHYPYYYNWNHDRDGDGWRDREWRERRDHREDWREHARHEEWREHHHD